MTPTAAIDAKTIDRPRLAEQTARTGNESAATIEASEA